MTWIYKGEVFDDPSEELVGFVYKITNKTNNRMYIGKKGFWKIRKYKTKPKRRKINSGWEKYFGSSKELLKDIEEIGEDKFTREILFLCLSKGDMAYLEAKEQFDRKVLLKQEYYNNFIGCRIHSKFLKGIK